MVIKEKEHSEWSPISRVGGFSFLVFLSPRVSILKFWIVFCFGNHFLFESIFAGCVNKRCRKLHLSSPLRLQLLFVCHNSKYQTFQGVIIAIFVADQSCTLAPNMAVIPWNGFRSHSSPYLSADFFFKVEGFPNFRRWFWKHEGLTEHSPQVVFESYWYLLKIEKFLWKIGKIHGKIQNVLLR